MPEATVADCERVQAAWNEAVSLAGGGDSWQDGALRWSWQAHDGQLMLNFPRSIDATGVRRGLAAARERRALIVGAWLAEDVDPDALERTGFERGWSPRWMQAPLDAGDESADPRITLSTVVPEYPEEGQALLSLASRAGAPAWHVIARVDGALAGRAFGFRVGDMLGVFDMDVWPAFRRRGLGRGMLQVLRRAAYDAGAHTAVLNATPEGARLYGSQEFTDVGTGVTYWHHLR